MPVYPNSAYSAINKAVAEIRCIITQSICVHVRVVCMCVYSANLNIIRQLNDHVAEGRACGNLGNTHYLLGNFSLAISFHQEVTSWLSDYFMTVLMI